MKILEASLIFAIMADLVTEDWDSSRFLVYLCVLLASVVYDVVWLCVYNFQV